MDFNAIFIYSTFRFFVSVFYVFTIAIDFYFPLCDINFYLATQKISAIIVLL